MAAKFPLVLDLRSTFNPVCRYQRINNAGVLSARYELRARMNPHRGILGFDTGLNWHAPVVLERSQLPPRFQSATRSLGFLPLALRVPRPFHRTERRMLRAVHALKVHALHFRWPIMRANLDLRFAGQVRPPNPPHPKFCSSRSVPIELRRRSCDAHHRHGEFLLLGFCH